MAERCPFVPSVVASVLLLNRNYFASMEKIEISMLLIISIFILAVAERTKAENSGDDSTASGGTSTTARQRLNPFNTPEENRIFAELWVRPSTVTVDALLAYSPVFY